jgi:hypothetical protein
VGVASAVVCSLVATALFDWIAPTTAAAATFAPPRAWRGPRPARRADEPVHRARGIDVPSSSAVTFEESEVYAFHKVGLELDSCTNSVVRR